LSGIVTLLVSEFGLLWNCWQLGGVMVRNGLMNTGQWIWLVVGQSFYCLDGRLSVDMLTILLRHHQNHLSILSFRG